MRNPGMNGRGESEMTPFGGELRRGRYSGNVRVTNEDGSYYFGEMMDDLFHGTGKFVYENGDQVVGQFHRGECTYGHVTYCNVGATYSGEVIGRTPHGMGTMWYIDGSCYHGYWMNGIKHGWFRYRRDETDTRDHWYYYVAGVYVPGSNLI